MSMFIGYMRANIFISHSRSLKNKRQIVLRVKQRLRNNFNVAIAEKPSDKWQICELSFVCVSYRKNCVHEMIDAIEEFLKNNCEFSLLEAERQII